MKINFYPLRHFDAASLALGAAGPAGLAVAAAQTALGAVQAISGGARAKRLMKQRRAFETPEAIFKLMQSLENRATSGYDPGTLQYLTSTADNALSSSLEVARQLGADPNQLSNLLDQRIRATFRIGAENQLRNMENFARYTLQGLQIVADNAAAEQKSRQDIIKDQLQAAGAAQQAGLQNIAGGINTGLATLSSMEMAKLYRELATQQPGVASTALPRDTTPATLAPVDTSIGGVGGRRVPDTLGGLTLDQILQLLNKINK